MSKTVLIVEDDADILEAVCETLQPIAEGNNAILREARDGQDALDKFDGSVVLVISDLNMPNLDGVDLLRRLRERGVRTPFILWSTYLTPEAQRAVASTERAECFRKLEQFKVALARAAEILKN